VSVEPLAGSSKPLKEKIMRNVLMLLGLVAFLCAIIFLLQRSSVQADADASEKEPTAAPEFTGTTQWLQSKPLTVAALRGQVVVVHFWTFGCINCIHNYPVYRTWQEKYDGKGVTIVGIHTPEFQREADVKQVQAKAEQNRLKFPIAVDSDQSNWKNWKNRYWPSIYLVDKQGQVRYHWDGELDLDKAEGRQFAAHIDALLAEKP
jgi:thiol-disulfide isomerase/thioredoxin